MCPHAFLSENRSPENSSAQNGRAPHEPEQHSQIRDHTGGVATQPDPLPEIDEFAQDEFQQAEFKTAESKTEKAPLPR